MYSTEKYFLRDKHFSTHHMYDAQLELLEADENEGDLEWSLKNFTVVCEFYSVH